MKKIYAEVGIGNESFLSTEIEQGKKEYREKKFIMPNKLEEFYLRLWIIKLVMSISLFKGIKFKRKSKSKFKLVFGFGGRDK